MICMLLWTLAQKMPLRRLRRIVSTTHKTQDRTGLPGTEQNSWEIQEYEIKPLMLYTRELVTVVSYNLEAS